MLPKPHHLKKEKEIERVFKKGKGVKDDLLFLKVAKNSLSYPRFCFIVSKKVSNKAVKRNRIRRRLREAVAKRLKEIPPGFDVVISFLASAGEAKTGDIEQSLNKLFAKLNV